MKTFLQYIEEKSVLGLIEFFNIEGIGKIPAKLDSGNGAYNVIHGEDIQEQGDKVFKFCSTRDMFSYYLDPENTRNVSQILVHDMSKMPWGSDSIDDKYFIDAKTAWFVTGSEKTGAMGKTLASFSLQSDAQAFADEFGGKVLSFADVNQDSLW